MRAKALQSLCVGVPSLIFAGIKMWSCLNVLDKTTVVDGHMVNELGNAAVMNGPCTENGPGNELLAQLALLAEPLKMITTWAAFVMLVTGYATGGRDKCVSQSAGCPNNTSR